MHYEYSLGLFRGPTVSTKAFKQQTEVKAPSSLPGTFGRNREVTSLGETKHTKHTKYMWEVQTADAGTRGRHHSAFSSQAPAGNSAIYLYPNREFTSNQSVGVDLDFEKASILKPTSLPWPCFSMLRNLYCVVPD